MAQGWGQAEAFALYLHGAFGLRQSDGIPQLAQKLWSGNSICTRRDYGCQWQTPRARRGWRNCRSKRPRDGWLFQSAGRDLLIIHHGDKNRCFLRARRGQRFHREIGREGSGRALGQACYRLEQSGRRQDAGRVLRVEVSPDGYTLLLVSSSYAVNPAVYSNMTFDTLNDMTPIINVAQNPTIITVNPSLPVRTLGELIAYAKVHPNKLTFASSGTGGLVHLNTEAFMQETGTKMVHVPYRGSGPAALALLAGEAQLFVGDAGSTSLHILAGMLRGLAVSNNERFALLPNIPTLSEAGFTAFDMPIWQGIIVSKGTPDAIVKKLNTEINAIPRTDEMKKTISQQLFVPVGGSPSLSTL